jgi:hypothetical protein
MEAMACEQEQLEQEQRHQMETNELELRERVASLEQQLQVTQLLKIVLLRRGQKQCRNLGV